MRQAESTRRRFFSLLLILLMVISNVSAEGLFPSMEQMFGTAMPSVGVALGRIADEIVETERGNVETYHGFTSDDYTAFGAYLAGVGAVLKDIKVTESAITVILSVRGASMEFAYDWTSQTATAIYSSGTRSETEKEAVEAKVSILPPLDDIMSSALYAVGRESSGENGVTQIWLNFTEADYTAFGTYLAQAGATLKQNSVEGGILNAEINLNASNFTFIYDWNTKSAAVVYPVGISLEREQWNMLKGNESILPQIDTIVKNLPSMSQAIYRGPDAMETLADGSRQETYNNFQEEDYTAFSQYLQTSGCVVEDYHVEDSSVIVIQLSNLTGTFTFTYDSLRHIGTVTYPKNSRIEAAWVAPTATPKPADTATPKPLQNYTESWCWSVAERYFKNMSWKNPSSVTIHSHTATYDASENIYMFYIDYSAQNGFGGYNRSFYFITVSAATGLVTAAFGEN